ncbi:MAG: hypothetical protein ACTS4U_01050 [Candidatus Hodgkinia cicadicola]
MWKSLTRQTAQTVSTLQISRRSRLPLLLRTLVPSQKPETRFPVSKQTETNRPQILRKSLKPLETNPSAVLTASKQAIATVCKVSAEALTFGLGVPALLQSLILSLLSKGDEVILCDRETPSAVLQVFTSLAMPVVVKGENFQTCASNVLTVTNPKTKLVYMSISSNFRALKPLQRLRDRLPASVTLVFDFGRADFPALASSPTAEGKLTGNVIVLRTFPLCSPSLNFAWMYAKALRISPHFRPLNPFTINKVTKPMMVNAINDFRRWSIQASGSLFWGTKVAFQILSNRLTLRNVQSSFVTIQLSKRLPTSLAQQWFKAQGASIGKMSAHNSLNSIKFRLTSAAANSRFARPLSSLKTMAAVVKTTCAHPFRPSPAFWVKAPPPLRRR